MTYIVNTCAAPFCDSQDRPGGVPVPTCGVATVRTREGSFGELEVPVGSPEAARTRHGRVGGRDGHHLTSGPHGTLNKFATQVPEPDVRGFPRHRGLREELESQVFNRDQLVVTDDPLRPHATLVCSLAGGALVQLRHVARCVFVALRSRVPGGPSTTTLSTLSLRKLRGTATAMSRVWQVVAGLSGGRWRSDAPIDANGGLNDGQGFNGYANDEAGVPMPQWIKVNPNQGRSRRNIARPDDGHYSPARQPQPTVHQREATCGERQRWPRLFLFPHLRPTSTTDSERIIQRCCVVSQRLLLHNMRPRTQPPATPTGLGQELRENSVTDSLTTLLHRYSLVPHKARAVPLCSQVIDCGLTWPKPVCVTDDLLHDTILPDFAHEFDMRQDREETA